MASERIRLGTWNIQLGLDLGNVLEAARSEPDLAQIDLLALQEVSVREKIDDAHTIASALGPEYRCYQAIAHFRAGRAQANALVWNSRRFELQGESWVTLPRAHQVKLSAPEQTLLRALPQQQRISLVVEGRVGSISLRAYVAHLDVLGMRHKLEQFSFLLRDALARPQVDLTVIAGDLNTFGLRSHPSWLNLTRAARAAGFVDLTTDVDWTHAVRRLGLRQKLDGIWLAARRPVSHRAWSLDIPGSDHIPVFAEIVTSVP